MKFIRITTLTAIVLITSGCSSLSNKQMSEKTNESSENKNFVEMVTTSNDEVKEKIRRNQAMSITRQEQVQLTLNAAMSGRVKPILMEQPRFHVVYFAYSEHGFKNEWDELLKKHADYISTDMSIRLLVAGFTDAKGSAKYNLQLGQRRADHVCDKLIQFGARKEQLTCVSYGESHPADPRETEAADARNRRVELLY